MTTFYISDTHFSHKAVIDFCNRPFNSVEEMDETMISNWNKVVSKEDKVVHLGDFCFGGINRWKEILNQLNGKIILVKGNHDRSKVIKKLHKEGYFEEIHEVGTYFKKNKLQFWLTHYPMQIGERPYKFSLSGHIHDEESIHQNEINLGVDSDFVKQFNKVFGTPIEENELFERLHLINEKMINNCEKRSG